MVSIFQRRVGWQNFFKDSPITSIIILINTALFIYTIVYGIINGYGFGISFEPDHLVELGAITGSTINDPSELWRIITAGFLHGSLIHYLSNIIIGVLTLSAALERMIGSKKFSIIYFGSLLIAGLVVVVFSAPYEVTIGASGAIFGVLGSLLYITFYRKDMMSIRDSQSIRALIVINIVFTFLAAGISIPGHVGGVLAGFLISFLVIKRKKIITQPPRYEDIFEAEYTDTSDDNYH